MHVSLQEGLYELCRIRIAGDEEFKAAAKNRNFNSVDDVLFDEYKLFQLRRTLKLVNERASFYRKLYAANGLRPEIVQSLDELRKLPFTYPEDLSGTSYGFLCTSQGDVEKPVTFYSSGSTGMKKRIFFSNSDIQKILDFLPRGMNTVIGRGEGRCQVFLQNTHGRGIGGILAESLNIFGMKAWASDLSDEVEDIIKLTLDNRVNVWFGEAITILRATRILAERMDLAKLGMKCIFITMANIPDSMVKYLERAWNCRVSTHYGLTESGWGLAVDCEVCGCYHYDELNHIIEIVDPETGEPMPDGGLGEITLTNIARDCMPLIRYRTGDLARMEKSRCGCHLQTLGHIVRRKEGACAAGNGKRLYPTVVDEAVFSIEEALDYRIFADGDRLIIELETLHERPETAELLVELLMQEEPLRGGKAPVVEVLPCGALRKFCFEKKRILPIEKRYAEDEP